MKKLLLLIAIVAFTVSFTACTPENRVQDEQLTDKDKNCAPNDQNCNGIPDNEE